MLLYYYVSNGRTGKNRNVANFYWWGGVSDETILEQSLSNRGRKQTAAVAKAQEAGAEKSGNRTHCGVEEE